MKHLLIITLCTICLPLLCADSQAQRLHGHRPTLSSGISQHIIRINQPQYPNMQQEVRYRDIQGQQEEGLLYCNWCILCSMALGLCGWVFYALYKI